MNRDLLTAALLLLGCLACVLGFLGILTETLCWVFLGVLALINLSISALLVWILVAFAQFLGRAARK
jgi:hypothetical protein